MAATGLLKFLLLCVEELTTFVVCYIDRL